MKRLAIGTRVHTTMGIRQSGTVTAPFYWKESTDGTYREPTTKDIVWVRWDNGTKGWSYRRHVTDDGQTQTKNPLNMSTPEKVAIVLGAVGGIAALIYYYTRPATSSTSAANNVVLQPNNQSVVDNAGITVTPPIGGLWVAPSPYAGTATAIPIPALPAGSPATTTPIVWSMNGQTQTTQLTLTSS